ncbi:MAG TPA: VanZ family protein [Bryobacteraceae bacterium]|nr:VanZ family protein [Bryobacteraceae bacterium]
MWGLAICTIATGSLLPSSALHALHYDDLNLDDKLVHVLNYTILGGLPVVALEVLGLGVICAGAMIFFGACLELIQTLVPGRSAEVGDLVANICGVVAGVLVALVVRRALRWKHP